MSGITVNYIITPPSKENKGTIMEFIFVSVLHDMCRNSKWWEGRSGRHRACRLWVPPMVGKELVEKGYRIKYLQQIGSSVRDE